LDANSTNSYRVMRRGGSFKTATSNIEQFMRLKGSREKPNCIVQFIRTKINAHETEEFIRRWERYNCEPRIVWLNTWAGQLANLIHFSDDLCPNRLQERLPCAELWFKMVITWEGKVIICCHDWTRDHIVGDINNMKIAQIWNSSAMREFRLAHITGKYANIDICSSCLEWSREEEIYEYL
jgi:radical SAM protein with 4Fe4S-binding SPASM domain